MASTDGISEGEICDAVQASGGGIFMWNVEDSLVRGCAKFSALHGATAGEGVSGVPMERLAEAVHEDDRRAFFQQISAHVEDGGALRAAYRTRPLPGVVRALLVSGRFERGRGVALMGRGVVFDVTAASARNPAVGIDGPPTRDVLSTAIVEACSVRDRIVGLRSRLSLDTFGELEMHAAMLLMVLQQSLRHIDH